MARRRTPPLSGAAGVQTARTFDAPAAIDRHVLQASGFRIDTRRTHSGSVPAGMAIGSPSSGQVLPSGAQVVLIVSQGE